MTDQKETMIPNKHSDEAGEEDTRANAIVLQPVVPSPEAEDSPVQEEETPRLRRKKRPWPPRSPSPSTSKKGGVCLRTRPKRKILKEEVDYDSEKEGTNGNGSGDFEVEVEAEEGAQYQCTAVLTSEADEETEISRPNSGKRFRSRGQIWEPICTLASDEMFQKWKKESDETIAPARWTRQRTCEVKKGMKWYYICNAHGCRAGLVAMYPNEGESVVVLHNSTDHVHTANPKQRGLPPEIKQEVKRMFDEGLRKPKLIENALFKAGLGDFLNDCRLQRQLSNCLHRLRKSSSAPAALSLSMSALKEWCTEHSVTQPSATFDGDLDRVFVFDHKVDEKTRQFRFVLSSKRLMKFAAQASTINLDAGHSMRWYNALVLFVGVSDAGGQFFPILFAVVSHETKANYSHLLKLLKQWVEASSGSKFQPGCVIGHSGSNLTDAVKEVFPSAVRRLCWLQVKKETNALLRHVDKDVRDTCDKDLRSLQLSASKKEFELASKLLLKKWRGLLPSSEAPGVFEELFLKPGPGWYEGFDIASPSSNRKLMQAVNAVKNRHMLRERLPPERYTGLAVELVIEWSLAVSEMDVMKTSVEPSDALLKDTCRLQSEQKTMVEVNSAIYVPVGDRTVATVEEVNAFESKMRGDVATFDEFVEARMSLWKVEDTEGKSDFTDMRCTCPRFFSEKLCEHVLAISSAFGHFTLPQSAWDAVQGTPAGVRKRGRPPKAKKAERPSADFSEMEAYMEGNEFGPQ